MSRRVGARRLTARSVRPLRASVGLLRLPPKSPACPVGGERCAVGRRHGRVDAGRVNARLGIALARSGDYAGAQAALAQATDSDWASVAGFWSTWIDQQNRKAGAA